MRSRRLVLSVLGSAAVVVAALNPATAAVPVAGTTPSASHGSWSQVGPLPRKVEGATAVRLHDGRALVFNSWTSSDAPDCLRAVDVFDPVTATWSTVAPMHLHRCGAAAVVLRSGKVLVAGGSFWPDRPHGPLYRSTAEVYDPRTDRWSFTGRMHRSRDGGAMVLLPSGRVLLAGGSHLGGSLAESEVYHPGTGRWTVTDPMRASRSITSESAATLPNGDVLVAGGQFDRWDPSYHGHLLRTAERYVVARHTWRRAGAMTRRAWPTLFTLPDGQVLAIHTSGRGVDRYRPATNRWHRMPSLPPVLGKRDYFAGGVVAVAGQPMVLVERVTCHPSRNIGVGYLWRPGPQAWVRWTVMPRPLAWAAVVGLMDGSTLVVGGVSRYYSCMGGDHLPTRYAFRYHPGL